MFRRVLAVCLVFVVPVLALTAQARPLLLQPTDPLFGTWVNPGYEGNIVGVAAKSTFFADGSSFDYYKVADSEPSGVGSFRLESVWIDGEANHWYKMVWVGDSYPVPLKEPRFKAYALLKINPAGDLLEIIMGSTAYPKDLKDLSYQNSVPMQYRRQ